MHSRKIQKWKFIISDYIALNVGWLIFTVIRYLSLPILVQNSYPLSAHLVSSPVLLGQILFPLMMLVIYWITGSYQNVFFKSRIDETVNIFAVSAVGTLAIYFIAMINDQISTRLENYELIIILWALLSVPVLIERLIIITRSARKIRKGLISFNTLVIGTTRGALKLAKKISQSRRGAFNIIGYVETRPSHEKDSPELDKPVYRLSDIERICNENDVSRLIVVSHPFGMKETGELINSLLPLEKRIYITPDLYSLIALRPRMDDIAGELLIDITRTKTSVMTLNLKRIGDVFVSALTLVLLSPLYLALAIAVKRDSKGPVFYRQERIGLHKKPFKIIKFRSMITDAEADGPALTSIDDPRITKLGAFMRKYRLDELPQFWNVLKGDMSLVGPRPERDYYIKQIVKQAPYYNLLHQIRPGITSWGMVKYGYASDVEQMIERLRYDLVYIENISLGVDIKILFHTVHTVLTGKGV